jgi:predicted MFS family arabinose efflux permease
VGVLALATAAGAGTPGAFLAAALFIGLGSVAVQVLVPLAAHLAPEAVRGQRVGKVMSGLLLGIMLARPVSSFITAALGWRAVFVFSTLLVAALAAVLAFALPRRQPAASKSYRALLGSLWGLLVSTPVLRERSAYHAALFGAFSLFWTAVPLFLAGPAFHFKQGAIALFALAGVAGAIAAPIAGRWADRGHAKVGTFWAILVAAASFLLAMLGPEGSSLRLVALVGAAVLLDMSVSANLVLGQREIFMLAPELRGRLNGLYLALFFAGGAAGSALGGWAYATRGWWACAAIGFSLPLLALAYFLHRTRGGAMPVGLRSE